jgi:hypothetical protein
MVSPDMFDAHWNAFCDADHGDYPEGFIDDCEARGLAELVPVTPDALDEAFAAERGIVPGGSMWALTAAGREAFAKAQTTSQGSSDGE